MIKLWKRADIKFLIDRWDHTDLKDIARNLHRTSNSVAQKARVIGLRSKAAKDDLSHQRMRDKPSRPPTKQERLFMGWVVIRGCQVPGCNKAANFHHEKFLSQGGTHKSGVGFCKFHHQDGKQGRHAMSRERFNETYKIDVLALAKNNWDMFLNE